MDTLPKIVPNFTPNVNQNNEKLFIDVYGADLGYGIIKLFGPMIKPGFVSRIAAYDKSSYFAVIHELEDLDAKDDSSDLLTYGLSLKNLVIRYDKKTYLVGYKAVRLFPTRTGRDYDADKHQRIEDTLKFLVGLSCMYPHANEIFIDTLVLGLSLESFSKYKDEIINQYSNFNINYEVPNNKGKYHEVKVHITHCRCIAQGDGVFFDNILELTENGSAKLSIEGKSLQTLRSTIVDPGCKTIDCFAKEGFTKVPGSNIVFPYGMTYAYQYVSKNYMANCDPNRIENEYLTYIYAEQNAARRNHLRWQTTNYAMEDVVKWCREGFLKVAEEITKNIDKNPLWIEEFKVSDLMIIAGGSAAEIIDYFKTHYEKYGFEVRMAEDPQYANVRGYVKSELFRRIANRQSQ